jgi:hypothetical protein
VGVCALRENAVGVHGEMDALVWVDITSVRTSFYNFVCTGNLINLREGEKSGRGSNIIKFAR